MCRDSGGSEVILQVLHVNLYDVFQPKRRKLNVAFKLPIPFIKKKNNNIIIPIHFFSDLYYYF